MNVVNLHEEGNFAENFFCHVLKGGTNFCSSLSSSHKNSSNRRRLSKENLSVNLDYDILGVYAYENGLIDPKFRRHDIFKEIEKYATSLHIPGNGTDYFRNCLDKNATEKLRQSSLEYEKWFIDVEKKNSLKDSRNIKPSLSVDDQYGNFNADWEAALAKNVFCSIDAKKTLTIQHWKKFFTRFKKST